ncbi:hypothetical protein B0H17DRAFT_1199366 [Mycena rosella]|uniref:Uncharacterized protein n=1 Tax=Mycena rosella TaxID=1033263 RepID=A0AAD7DKV5_MYCRO|nr:hypothetical protein B0H17DRAFT_1199366 [Mycena rosella]
MTPSKPPDVLRRLRRSLQSGANDIQEDEALFVVDPDVFTVAEDEDFDPLNEFTSDKNKIQGQLRQILAYLPDDVRHLRTTDLIAGAFANGMSGQRSSTSNRLRGQSLAKIVDEIKPFATATSRKSAFAEFIGYQPGTKTREPYYSKLDVPVLHDEWRGEKDLNTIFRNPILLKIYASQIRGPNGADGLFSGRSKRPMAKMVEKMHKILRTTPGAISNCSVLAVWLYSPDTQLAEIGDETLINYCERHTYYLQQIVEGLANNKAWALDLLAHWDRVLFPDADEPRDVDGSAGNSRLEEEEDNDEFFASAPHTSPRRSTAPQPAVGVISAAGALFPDSPLPFNDATSSKTDFAALWIGKPSRRIKHLQHKPQKVGKFNNAISRVS